MNRDRYRRAKEIFLEACALAEPARAALLDARCAADAEMRRTVESMLSADAADGHGLDRGAVSPAALAALAAAAEEPLPRRVGRYGVLALLGEGGMGRVYEAEQDSPRRRVAVKVIRPEFVSAESRRRFSLEISALARLDHRGIARIFDAGIARVETADGAGHDAPFFAMELVAGVSLDRFVREQRPAVRDLVAMLADAADAVHHAHQKGVVHRDLKPANMLVVADPAGPCIKLLDFGVARLTREGRSEVETVSLAETFGRAYGTLAYMSPEQADPGAPDVDARADIYALGGVIYEALAGRPPLDLARLPLPDAVRQIRERVPVRLGVIDPALRGDLETIIAKALEKEPARRYASAAALADDLRRHLRHEPIAARPPTALYHMGRFARRNRPLVGATAAVAASLLLLLAGSIRQAAVLARSSESEREARIAAEAGTELARGEAAKFQAVTEFLQEMLASAEPGAGPGRPDLTLTEVLDFSAARLDAGRLGEHPEAVLALRMTLGNSYRALARHAEAERHLAEAVTLGRRLYPAGHPDLAWALNKLARLHEDRGRYAEAGELLRESLLMHRAMHGDEHPEVAKLMNNLGHLLYLTGDLAEARRWHEESIALRRKYSWSESAIATSLNNLANVMLAMADFAGAEESYRESLRLDRAARGAEHPNIAITQQGLAVALREQERFDEAHVEHAGSLAMLRRFYGDDHPTTAAVRTFYAALLERMGRRDEALAELAPALETLLARLGPDHPRTAFAKALLGRLLVHFFEHSRAETLLREAIDAFGATPGNKAAHAQALIDLASLLDASARPDDAARSFAHGLEVARAAYTPGDPRLGRILLAVGEHELARGNRPADILREAAAALTGHSDHGRALEALRRAEPAP